MKPSSTDFRVGYSNNETTHFPKPRRVPQREQESEFGQIRPEGGFKT